MLKTLKQFENCEISLTFNNENNIPVLVVCYLNKCFKITYLAKLIIETYDDIESTLTAIDNAMHASLQETSN